MKEYAVGEWYLHVCMKRGREQAKHSILLAHCLALKAPAASDTVLTILFSPMVVLMDCLVQPWCM